MPPELRAAFSRREVKKAPCTKLPAGLLGSRWRGVAGLRARALLLVGDAGALRRSELVAIDREHLRFTPEGVRVLVPAQA